MQWATWLRSLHRTELQRSGATMTETISSTKFLFVALIPASIGAGGFGAKILFVPANMNSHVHFFSRLAVDLAQLGHVTRVLAPSNARVPEFAVESQNVGRNFSYTTYAVDGDKPFINRENVSAEFLRVALSRSLWERFLLSVGVLRDYQRHCESDCNRLLENERVMQQIRGGGYQFAVMDPVAPPQCYYAIPYSMGIPYASLSAGRLEWLYRVPRLHSFRSSLGLPYTDRMNFVQRLTTFVFGSLLQLILSANSTTTYVDRLAPDRPSLNSVQLLQRASLWLYMEHISTGYALPHMPNTVSVGDIMAGRPGEALPRELDDFISAAKDGVLLVSFGSYIDLPAHGVARKFCDAFADGRNRLRVVWKTQHAKLCADVDDRRVKLVSALPQNDLLADPRVRIFISHGGGNGIMESVYHSTPLVIFPIVSDQLLNAAAAESKGFAIRMDIGDFTPDSLLSNVEKVLTDPTYRRSAQLASAILRDQRDTPAQRVSAMIDHVIKYGDRHLRTGAFELSTAEFFMVDIFAFLLAAAAAALLVVVLTCCCVYRTCRRRCCKQKKSKIS